MNNPYQAPSSNLASASADGNNSGQGELLERLATGCLIVKLCLFSWLAAGAFRILETHPFGEFYLGASIIAAFVGTKRIAAGLALSTKVKRIASLGSAVPFVGLFVMVWINARAVKVLQSAGYTVGMFQSRRTRAA
jgi:hypothetical protein